MPYEPTTNFKDSNNVDLGKKLVTKDYLLSVYGTILESSPATGLVVTPELWTWGRNDNGQLGNNSSGNKSNPVTTFSGGTNWKQISVGTNHMAAIKTDGSLWVWGNNSFGQIGVNNATGNIITPVTTFAGGTDWKQVSCGEFLTAATKTDGTLWVWGANGSGQLGINNTDGRTTPVTTFAGGTTWKSVDCGVSYTTAIKTDGSLWTWGKNGYGQLGINNTDGRTTPVTTFAGGTTWKSVSAGTNHIVAVKTDGSLWTWGRNHAAQLGINVSGSTTGRTTPVTTFVGGTTWKSVSGGGDHTAAIKTDGTLWNWGFGGSGQLGTNSTASPNTPVTTFAGGTNWKSVDCGDRHTIAIKTDGTLWTWGRTEEGQLGDNTTITIGKSIPITTFAGGNDWKSASAGNTFTSAIRSNDYI